MFTTPTTARTLARTVTLMNQPGTRAFTRYARPIAANVLQRVYRGYKARRNRKLRSSTMQRNGPVESTSPIAGPARHIQTGQQSPDEALNSRQQFKYNITSIPQGDSPSQRARDIVYLRGFKICGYWKNTESDHKIFLNWAVLRPKFQTNVDKINFFRSNGSERAIDFDEAANTFMDYHCRPLNSDKYYIKAHERLVLDCSSSGRQQSGNDERRVMKYVAINEEIQYTNVEGIETCTTPWYFVWWCDKELNGSGAVPEAVVINDLRLITYFRNPPN